MQSLSARTCAVAIGVCGFLGTTCAAFGEGHIVIHGVEFAEPPTAMSIETDDGWRFEPAYSGGEFVGILAMYSGVEGTPASICTAWFEPAGEGEWAASGWQNATEESAAAYMMWFYQDAEMFSHAAGLTDVDWDMVVAANAPVALRFGFDEDDPFQPVLEVVGPEIAEALVDAGAAGMPVLAPMAVPNASGGQFTLACLTGELAEEFSELSEDGLAAGGGCAGLLDWCFPWTYKYNSHITCTQWSPWILGGSGGSAYCERRRHCTQHWTKVKVHLDCSTTTTTGSDGPQLQVQRNPASPGPACP